MIRFRSNYQHLRFLRLESAVLGAVVLVVCLAKNITLHFCLWSFKPPSFHLRCHLQDSSVSFPFAWQKPVFVSYFCLFVFFFFYSELLKGYQIFYENRATDIFSSHIAGFHRELGEKPVLACREAPRCAWSRLG